MLMNITPAQVIDSASPAELNELIRQAQMKLTEYARTTLTDEEKQLVDETKWIAAIKLLRTRTGFDLLTSKHIVEDYRDRKNRRSHQG